TPQGSCRSAGHSVASGRTFNPVPGRRTIAGRARPRCIAPEVIVPSTSPRAVRPRAVAVLAAMIALFAIAMGRLGARAGAPAAGDARPTVALTFDDLPVHGALPPGLGRGDVARRILAALSQRHAPPPYGFVNAKALDGAPEPAEVLRLWQAAGHPLGNHTYSHMDLDANTAEAFERDVE